MLESRYPIDNRCFFKENFESLENTARLGGTSTSVIYSNGVGKFNGTSSSIQTRPQYMTKGMTVLARLKSSSVVAKSAIFTESTTLLGFYTRFTGALTGPIIYLGGSNYRYFTDSVNLYADGQYHLWAFVITGLAQTDINNAKCYVDGVSLPFLGGTANGGTGIKSLGLIGRDYAFSGYYGGEMEFVEIYNYAMNQDEIQAIYNNTKYKYWNPNMELRKWIKGTGTFVEKYQVPAGQKYFENTGIGYISQPSKQVYGTWEFTMYKASLTSFCDFHFISTQSGTYPNTGNGYLLSIRNSGENRTVRLIRLVGSNTTSVITSTINYTEIATYYRFRITRTFAGLFTVYIKGGAYTNWTTIGSATDNTYTKSNFVNFGPTPTTGDRISDIRFTPYII